MEHEPVHVSPKAFRLLELLIGARTEGGLQSSSFTSRSGRTSSWRNRTSRASSPRCGPPSARTRGSPASSRRSMGSVTPSASTRPSRCRTVSPDPPGPGVRAAPGRERLGAGQRRVRCDLDEVHLAAPREDRRLGRRPSMLEDLDSKNGTWVRGRRIAGPTEINDGDEIRLGSVPLVFRAAPAGSTETDIAE